MDADARQRLPNAPENRKRDPSGPGATTGRDNFEIVHDPSNGTIRLTGTEVGPIDGVHMSTCGVLRIRCDEALLNPLGDDEIKYILIEEVTQLQLDVDTFIIHAHPVLRMCLNPEEASKKLAAGDTCKFAAGGVSFHNLIEKRRGEKLTPNGYGLVEKIAQKFNSTRPTMSWEWTDLLPKEPTVFEETLVEAYSETAYRSGNCCFLSTKTGYVGHAGHLIQKGDILCILFGCRLPAILRLHDGGSYKLITFTYTLDIMEGDFLRDHDSLQVKGFLLR